jgi:AraC-like DNA-binding protein
MASDFYREVAPPADLAPYVACTWTRVVDRAAREPIIPDACADIVVIGDRAPHIAGPADRAAWVELRGGTVVRGLRFRPGAARAVLRTDMDELRNQDVELADVVGGAAHELELDPDRVEHALLGWVRARISRSCVDPCDVTSLLLRTRSIDEATAAIGWSARSLHRHMSRACGYGPKLVQRILRLQRAIRIAHDGAPTLASVAAAADYADQAHMTREFVELTDLPPSDYLERADPRVGTWLVSDLFKTARRS